MQYFACSVRAAALACLIALAAAGWFSWQWWHAPAPVADHSSLFSGTAAMSVAGSRTLAERVIPTRNGLSRVDLLLAAESAGLPGAVELSVQEWPSRRDLRHSSVPASSLPSGTPWDVRPGLTTERWASFTFDPVPDSAGREFLLVVSYPDGEDTGDSRVGTLARFPNDYSRGQILVNGSPENGTLLFRLVVAGTNGAAVRAVAWNMARRQPLLRGTLIVPGGLALGCAVSAGILLGRVTRRTESSTWQRVDTP